MAYPFERFERLFRALPTAGARETELLFYSDYENVQCDYSRDPAAQPGTSAPSRRQRARAENEAFEVMQRGTSKRTRVEPQWKHEGPVKKVGGEAVCGGIDYAHTIGGAVVQDVKLGPIGMEYQIDRYARPIPAPSAPRGVGDQGGRHAVPAAIGHRNWAVRLG
jgi:hypothetical protein